MDPITVSATIQRPIEEVFEYLSDIANHAEFMDHWRKEWHLTRENSRGLGAGARFHVKGSLNRFSWADITFHEVNRPHRIIERGRGGKFNRIRMLGVWELSPGPAGSTKVEYTLETEVKLPSDRLLERRGLQKGKAEKAMRRLRAILEEDRSRGKRVTVAAR